MGAITDNFGLFVEGFGKSLWICVVATIGSLLLGTLIAAFRVSPVAPLRAFGTAWVHLIRNCPLTVVLFVIAFGLPEIGFNASYWKLGVGALILYTSAFICEAVRSGINSVPAGQAEAARAIGLGFVGTLRHVVLPQAMRSSIPPVGSVLIAMFKNSAVLGAFGVGGELFSVSETLTSAQGYAALPVLTGVAVGYLLITLPAAFALSTVERKLVIAR